MSLKFKQLRKALSLKSLCNKAGVLYYANNAFFQCLEGEEEILNDLMQRIMQDPRHHEINVFEAIEIKRIYFKKWSMKYVQKSSKIDLFFQQLNADGFHPSMLNEDVLPQFVNELLQEEQTKLRRKVGLHQRGINPYL
ncbi:BLUF domain-containing protein [Acinetobacter soli]|uniref:BLUF domain-containing protein n=1 Tax=Acinetobacter soli TaxID=487316 RepID=UPI002076FCE4|nr:BLUF domain-containing protein [Acinetobacter soli]